MTETMTEPTPLVPSGHAVGRFLVAVAVVCAALGALWWSGWANPRLSVSHVEAVHDPAAGQATLRVEVRNDNRSTVEIRGATFDYPWVDVRSVEVDGTDVARHPRIDAHDAALVELVFTVDCATLAEQQRLDPTATIYSDELLRVRVKATIGGEHTRTTQVRGALNTVIPQACPHLT